MRIERLTVQNFKKFTQQTFTLHPEFTLLVGENGSGKTSVLDALAISLGIWLVEPPDSSLKDSERNIDRTEIRLESSQRGDRTQFTEKLPVRVEAFGQIGEGSSSPVTWSREVSLRKNPITTNDASEALAIIWDIYKRDDLGENVICPVLAYYGAGRAWLPPKFPFGFPEPNSDELPRRWSAFRDCFNQNISFEDLRKWFQRETTAAGNLGGRMRPGFEAVKRAVLNCVPNADKLWFDPDREDIAFSIQGEALPSANLSAGQRMMLGLVADIAIKAVTQNAFLLPASELGPEDDPLPRVLQQTPGVVLIDEVDVHLHPKWQRHVIEDLRRTFPNIQFVGTTHSPFLIQSLRSGEELIVLDGQPPAQLADKPIEVIAQGIMGVANPQVSARYEQMKGAARQYLETLEEAALAPEDKLADFKDRLSSAIAPYADNPAFQAFLEMKRAAKLKE